MKRVALLLCCLCVAATLFADVKIVQKVKSDGVMGQKPQDGVMTMYIKSGKARIETQNSPHYQIMDVSAGKMFIVDSSKKEVMVISAEQMKQTSNMLSQLVGGKNAPAPTVQKLGTSKTYNGMNCDEYKITISGPMSTNGTYCVSSDINFDQEFAPLTSFSKELAQMFGGDAMKKLPGFPIHTDSTMSLMGQNMKSSTELVSYSRDTVPDTLFVVPSDYTVREAPKMPNQ
jgi:hypothetical protein